MWTRALSLLPLQCGWGPASGGCAARRQSPVCITSRFICGFMQSAELNIQTNLRDISLTMEHQNVHSKCLSGNAPHPTPTCVSTRTRSIWIKKKKIGHAVGSVMNCAMDQKFILYTGKKRAGFCSRDSCSLTCITTRSWSINVFISSYDWNASSR